MSRSVITTTTTMCVVEICCFRVNLFTWTATATHWSCCCSSHHGSSGLPLLLLFFHFIFSFSPAAIISLLPPLLPPHCHSLSFVVVVIVVVVLCWSIFSSQSVSQSISQSVSQYCMLIQTCSTEYDGITLPLSPPSIVHHDCPLSNDVLQSFHDNFAEFFISQAIKNFYEDRKWGELWKAALQCPALLPSFLAEYYQLLWVAALDMIMICPWWCCLVMTHTGGPCLFSSVHRRYLVTASYTTAAGPPLLLLFFALILLVSRVIFFIAHIVSHIVLIDVRCGSVWWLYVLWFSHIFCHVSVFCDLPPSSQSASPIKGTKVSS